MTHMTFSQMTSKLGIAILLIISLLITPGFGQIIADQTAPANTRPFVMVTSNGVPYVDIRTPNASGISLNNYSQFDVSSNGVILNNSRTGANTILGGNISANSWLATGSARIIVNQINSTNPSFLNGFVEVAGTPSEVVIANPSGINISGAGFINASGVTLTTGVPIFDNFNLTSYSVDRGLITISGTGLNTSGTEFTDIFSRGLVLNAGIWAKNLRIVTGANNISGTSVTSTGTGFGTAPQFAIDSSLLGGMYANKIFLIGTENGLGFNNLGRIETDTNNIAIDANGNLTNGGVIRSATSLNINSAEINNSRGHLEGANITVNTGQNKFVNDGGNITGLNDLSISSGELTNDAGTILSVGNLTIDTNGKKLTNINNKYYTGILGGGALNLITGDLNNTSGNIASQTVNISTAGKSLINASGNISGDTVNINSGELTNNNGTLLSLGDLSINTNQQGLFNTNSGSDRGIFSNGLLQLQTGIMNNSFGRVFGGTTNINTAGNILNNDGGTLAGDELTIDSGELSNNSATILSAGGLEINTNGNRLVNVNSGDDKGIFGGNLLKLRTGELINGTGNIMTSGTLDINTSANFLRNDSGFILAKDVLINSGEINNQSGTLVSSASLIIDTNGEKLTNTLTDSGSGIRVGTNLTIKAGALDNSQGFITSDGTANIDVLRPRSIGISQSNQLDNSFGLISGKGITINSKKLLNLGLISSTDFLNVNTNGYDLINKGNTESRGIVSTRKTTLRTGFFDNNLGRLVSFDIDIKTNGNKINNNGGFITALSSLLIDSGEVSNRDEGTIQSYNNLEINTNGRALYNTNSGSMRGIISKNTLALVTGQFDNTDGRVVSEYLDIFTGTNQINNDRGLIRGSTATIIGGPLNVGAGTILGTEYLNIISLGQMSINNGLVQSGNDLWIDTDGNDLLISNTQKSKGIFSGGNLNLSTGKLGLYGSTIASNGDLEINTNGQELINNHSGNADLYQGILKGDGIWSGGSLNLQTGRLDNNTGTIESVGDLTIDTGYQELVNASSGILLYPGGSRGTGGKGISSQGSIFLNTGVINNYGGTIRADGSITINTNGEYLYNWNSTPINDPNFPIGGQGIVSGEHLGIFNASLYNNTGLLQAQTYSLNGTPTGSPAGSVIDPYFDGKLTLTGIRHLVPGPVNVFRDPFDKQNWVLNGVSNSVSDYLLLDIASNGVFAAGNPDFPLGERVQGGAIAVGIAANLVLEGFGASSAIRWSTGQLSRFAPKITRSGGRTVSFDAFNGVKTSVKNRINPTNYEFKLDPTVIGSSGGGFTINYKGAAKWFDEIPQALKADIGDIDSDLAKLFDSATVSERAGLINSYDRLKTLGRIEMSKDPSILSSVRLAADNSNISANTLDNIINQLAASGARCRTCTSPGTPSLRFVDEVIEDINAFATEFSNTPGMNQFLDNLGQQRTASIGGSWTLEAMMRNRTKYFGNETIVGFEVNHIPGRNFAADVVTQSGTKTTYYEFKNWSTNLLQASNFADQMASTLSVINNLDEMRFVFNANRWTPDAAQVRTVLQNNQGLFDNLMNDRQRLSRLFPNDINQINSVDDLINILMRPENFRLVFQVQ